MMAHNYIVRSAIAKQAARSLAYAQALAAWMYLTQGTAHWNHPVRIVDHNNNQVGLHGVYGWLWAQSARKQAA